jgi:hypothetical protein
MAKRARRTIKIPVIYQQGPIRIEYVDKTPSELDPELARVRESVHRALQILARLSRLKHIAIVSARFQLQNCLSELKPDSSHDDKAKELARINYTMEDTLGLLNRLSNSRIEWLEAARFQLTYGQTPKKRDLAGPTAKETLNEEYGFNESPEGPESLRED